MKFVGQIGAASPDSDPRNHRGALLRAIACRSAQMVSIAQKRIVKLICISIERLLHLAHDFALAPETASPNAPAFFSASLAAFASFPARSSARASTPCLANEAQFLVRFSAPARSAGYLVLLREARGTGNVRIARDARGLHHLIVRIPPPLFIAVCLSKPRAAPPEASRCES